MIYHLKNVPNDYQLLLHYFQTVDNDFGISLSRKVDLKEYTSKLLKYGYVYAIMDENRQDILSCIVFYCNDMDTHIAYFPLLSTRADARGKGYAKLLVNEMIQCCKQKGMCRIICDSVNPVAVKLYKSLGFTEYQVQRCEQLTKTFLKLDLI